MKELKSIFWMCIFILATASIVNSQTDRDSGVVTEAVTGRGILWNVNVPYEFIQLRVKGPHGLVFDGRFSAGTPIRYEFLDDSGRLLPDGQYAYELRIAPELDHSLREEIRGLRSSGDTALRTQVREALGSGKMAHSGFFRLINGSAATPGRSVDVDGIAGESDPLAIEAAGAFSFNVIAEVDSTLKGDLCIGDGCPGGGEDLPIFGASTLLMMDRDVRIKFDDTSTEVGFAARDWQLGANEAGSGGAEKFFLQDCGFANEGLCPGSLFPFTVMGNSRNNALFVDSDGHVGLGTSTPAALIHAVSGESPALRLDQDGSEGMDLQAWDLVGNDDFFSVRDVTGGGLEPLRIQPGAPTGALNVSSLGAVGLGVSNPQAPVHLQRADGSAQVLVRETNATATPRTLFALENNGAVRFNFVNTATGDDWFFSQDGLGRYIISLVGTGGPEMLIAQNGRVLMGPGPSSVFDLSPTGDLAISGTLTQSSDRNRKADIEPVDSRNVLEKAAELPIATWRFDVDDESIRHMGPMAQDFYAAFGLGANDKTLSPLDVSAVALAAIQGLAAENRELRQRMESLERRLSALESKSAGSDDLE